MTPTDPPLRNLLNRLREAGSDPSRDAVLNGFLEYVAGLGLQLYPAQEEAILEILAGKHVILSTPTGSGKSLVALALHFLALAEKKRTYYTAPTKALVNEKFFALCDALGPEAVGLLTGDASVNRDAPVICCTAEILSNSALRQDNLPVDYVAIDEFHFYGDRERGVAWQIPLITMKNTVFLLMSATLGDVSEIQQRLSDYSGREVAWVRGHDRPVPLKFEYRDVPLHETIQDLLAIGEAPIYLVNFTQRDCAEQAQNLMSINVCSKEEKQAIAREIVGQRFDTPYGSEFRSFVKNGLGVHHAGLLPKYRRVVEKLSQTGLIKVISGTDTLGVGVNIPIRTVLLRQLYKFDGEQTVILRAREFHQIAGRAGRKGFDDHGLVVVQAPEWAIENKRIDAKVAANANLKKKLVKKKPPPRSLPWDRARFQRLVASVPEPLEPHFEVTHGMLVHLLHGGSKIPRGGYRRLIELIGRSHCSEGERRRLRRHAATLFRTLLRAGIVEVWPGKPGHGPEVLVRADLQEDFSLNRTLSLYLVQTLSQLDRQSPTFALDMLSLVEAIIENPKAILFRQEDRLKGELIARLKAQGMEYEERMAELEKVTYPKPNADFIYETFNEFARIHPWVGGEHIRPKSIAREMVEKYATFNDYVREYGIARSEGVLLRYLSQVYKTALQTVPDSFWNEEFTDILAFLLGLLRRTDSSLIEEWELLLSGPAVPSIAECPEAPAAPAKPRDLTANPRAFAARVRNELHVLLKALADRDYETACSLVHPTEENTWTPAQLEQAMTAFYAEHPAIDVTPRARLANNTILQEESPRVWIARQKILVPESAEGEEDWLIDCVIDLTEERDLTGPLIELRGIGN